MKIAIKSYGCAENHAEGEIMGGILQKKEEISGESEADVVVLNICTVKGNQTALREVKKIKKKYPEKKVVITGCVPKDIIAPIRQIAPNATFLGTNNIADIHNAVTAKTPYEQLGLSKTIKINQPRLRRNPLVGIVPICQGCLDACAFCSTRLSKGLLYSYPEENILQEIKDALKDGCKEIWLTGQDTACWGFDRKSNLANLMNSIATIPGVFRVRVGMGNPRHVLRYHQELIKAFSSEKFFKFLHLPVQSGNPDVLKSMKRGHDVDTVRMLVKSFRQHYPMMSFSTDIIVGFPGETEQQFEDTLSMIKELAFDTVNLARYAPRKGTYADTLKDMPGSKKKERSRKATKVVLDTSFKHNQRWVGWQGSILIDEYAKRGAVVGRNFAYKPVIVKEKIDIGSTVQVKIIKATALSLYGEMVTSPV